MEIIYRVEGDGGRESLYIFHMGAPAHIHRHPLPAIQFVSDDYVLGTGHLFHHTYDIAFLI